MYTLYFDGSCTKNPGGTVGIGFVVKDAQGVVLRRHSQSFKPRQLEGHQTTSNVAEYLALARGLEYMLGKGYTKDVLVLGDSRLVINQMFGTWKLGKSAPYVPFARDARRLLAWFDDITGRWIPREQNAIADSLSK